MRCRHILDCRQRRKCGQLWESQEHQGCNHVERDHVLIKPQDLIDILTVALPKKAMRAEGLKSRGTKQVSRDNF
jgi:hypothetical protein